MCLTRWPVGLWGCRPQRFMSNAAGPGRPVGAVELWWMSWSRPASKPQVAPTGRRGCTPSCAETATACPARLWRPPWPARGCRPAPGAAGAASPAPTKRPRRHLTCFSVTSPRRQRTRSGVGDFKQINTDQGPVFLATVQDLFSRRMLGFAQSDSHPTAELAVAALNMAAATRGGDIDGVIFHTDKGTQYTSGAFADACWRLGVTQSMGRVGCALDNAAAESFFSTLQHELISRRRWRTRAQARQDIADWIHTWYNPKRLHSTNNMTSPNDHELANAA